MNINMSKMKKFSELCPYVLASISASLLFTGEGNGNHSSVLAWRIPGTGEPGGLPSMGLHRVGHD